MMVERYRSERNIFKRYPLVNRLGKLMVPNSVVDLCPKWQDEGFPAFGIPPSTLFFYYPDGRWLLERPTGVGAVWEWEGLPPLAARRWLLDNGYALEELSESVRAALSWTSNRSQARRTYTARIARADRERLTRWRQRTGIARVDLLTQAVEALEADLGTLEGVTLQTPVFDGYYVATIRLRASGALRATGQALKLSVPKVCHIALNRFDYREATDEWKTPSSGRTRPAGRRG